MNKTIVILVLISLICMVGRLIGSFFDVPFSYYMPILIWLIALCIFDLLLTRKHTSVFLKIFDN